MKLLDAKLLINEGRAQLVEFQDERNLPNYAILSHTWADEEVLFHDLELGPRHEIEPHSGVVWSATDHVSSAQTAPATLGPHIRAGWNKILNACIQARKDGFSYIWIDTCCIDKSSSAELSEAINSMFRWYANSAACYVCLSDCTTCPILDPINHSTRGRFQEVLDSHENCIVGSNVKLPGDLHAQIDSIDEEFRDGLSSCMAHQWEQSRWLTRVWTLQELIAPRNIEFFDWNWYHIAAKAAILDDLVNITGIHMEGLEGDVKRSSVAQRMF